MKRARRQTRRSWVHIFDAGMLTALTWFGYRRVSVSEDGLSTSIQSCSYACRYRLYVNICCCSRTLVAQRRLGILQRTVMLKIGRDRAPHDLKRYEVTRDAQLICCGMYPPFHKIGRIERNTPTPAAPFSRCPKHQCPFSRVAAESFPGLDERLRKVRDWYKGAALNSFNSVYP